MLSIKLLDTEQEISKKINSATAEHFNSILNGKLSSIKQQVKSFTYNAILSQPEIDSLNGGILQGAFGLVDSSSAIKSIATSIQNSINVEFNKFDKNLKGGINIYIQPSDFTNLLALPEATNFTDDGDFPWLQWLITLGDTIIIVDYSFNPISGRGRSNLGYMTSGGVFRVPPEFAGDINNNFITRALVGKQQEKVIQNILMKAMQ